MKPLKRLSILMIFFLLMSACANKEPSVFNGDELKKQAESLVYQINQLNGAALYDISSSVITDIYTVEGINEYIEYQLRNVGAFDEIITTSFTETKHPLKEYPIAVLETVARFENGTLRYTFSFDEDNQIIGFTLAFLPK